MLSVKESACKTFDRVSAAVAMFNSTPQEHFPYQLRVVWNRHACWGWSLQRTGSCNSQQRPPKQHRSCISGWHGCQAQSIQRCFMQ